MSAERGLALQPCVRDLWQKQEVGQLGSPLILTPVHCFSSGKGMRSGDLPLVLLLLPHVVSSGAQLATAALPRIRLHVLLVTVQTLMLKPEVGCTRGACFPLALDKALGQQPASLSPAEPFFFSADCFFRLGELTYAMADYQQALELSPGNRAVQGRVAAVLHEKGWQDVAAR